MKEAVPLAVAKQGHSITGAGGAAGGTGSLEATEGASQPLELALGGLLRMLSWGRRASPAMCLC